MRPTLFIMVGLPGSGKTTLAKQLEQRHHALRLTPDEWMMPLFGWGESGDKRDVLENLLWNVAARTLELGLNAVLDYGLWGRWERTEYRARAEALGARVELHFLDLPLEELCIRVDRRNRNLQPGEVPITLEELTGWFEIFEAPTLEELASGRSNLSPESGA